MTMVVFCDNFPRDVVQHATLQQSSKVFLKAFITAVWSNRVVLKKVIQLRYITILQFYSDVPLQIPNRLEIDRFSSYCTRVTYVVGCLHSQFYFYQS